MAEYRVEAQKSHRGPTGKQRWRVVVKKGKRGDVVQGFPDLSTEEKNDMVRTLKSRYKENPSGLQINSAKGRKVKNGTRVSTTVGELRRLVNAAKKNRRTTIKVRTR